MREDTPDEEETREVMRKQARRQENLLINGKTDEITRKAMI